MTVHKFPAVPKGNALTRALAQVDKGEVPMIAFTVDGRKVVVISDEFSAADVFTASAFRLLIAPGEPWSSTWS